MRRACWLAALLAGCVSAHVPSVFDTDADLSSPAVMAQIVAESHAQDAKKIPSAKDRRPACAISCAFGWLARMSHTCKFDTRRFRDFTVQGDYVVRGDDGGKLIDAWVGVDGALYDKRDVEMGTCSAYINKVIAGRDPDKRGQHPGEDPQGNPRP